MKFNIELFTMLPSLLGSNKEHLYDKIGMTKLSYLWSLEHADIKLNVLVQLCNAYHIHIENFFRHGIPSKIVDYSNKWEPYYWEPVNLRRLWISRESPIVRRCDVMECLGMKPVIGNSTMIRLTSPGSALRASQWIAICNRFGIDYMLPFVSEEEVPNHLMARRTYKTQDTPTLFVAEE